MKEGETRRGEGGGRRWPAKPAPEGRWRAAAWGANWYGQLGDGTTVQKNNPTAISCPPGVTAVAAGYNHTVALRNDGTVLTWGYNSNGQLGNGTMANSSTPVTVVDSGGSGVLGVATGVVLFVFILMINLLLSVIKRRATK